MIILKKSRQHWQFHKVFFGSANDPMPQEFSFSDPSANPVQPMGDVKCGAYMITDIARAQDKVEYDIDFQFNNTPHTSEGSTAADAFTTPVKVGLQIKGTTTIVKKPGYFQCNTGPGDAYDNVSNAMWINKTPVGVASYWYREWNQGTSILPLGLNIGSGHMYEISGRQIVNGELCFVVEAWTGQTLYMNRTIFNAAMSAWGVYAGVLAMTSDEVITALKEQKYSYIKQMLDWVQNQLIAIKQSIFLNTPPIITPPMPTPNINPSQHLYDTAMALKGQYLTLDRSVPKEFNCAETISFILKTAGYIMPGGGFPGTIALNGWFIKNFEQLSAPEFGCIMIAVTQGNNHGHVWINGHEAMLSNDSQTGLLQSYWSLAGALDYYGKQKGLQINFFRPK